MPSASRERTASDGVILGASSSYLEKLGPNWRICNADEASLNEDAPDVDRVDHATLILDQIDIAVRNWANESSPFASRPQDLDAVSLLVDRAADRPRSKVAKEAVLRSR